MVPGEPPLESSLINPERLTARRSNVMAATSSIPNPGCVSNGTFSNGRRFDPSQGRFGFYVRKSPLQRSVGVQIFPCAPEFHFQIKRLTTQSVDRFFLQQSHCRSFGKLLRHPLHPAGDRATKRARRTGCETYCVRRKVSLIGVKKHAVDSVLNAKGSRPLECTA